MSEFIKQTIADATGTSPDEWAECDGPNNKGVPLTAWVVRRKPGVPDVYGVAMGDSEHMTIELIPAEPGEKDAHAVAAAVLACKEGTVETDIECGVVFDGDIGSHPIP